jgi:hypothetical protein
VLSATAAPTAILSNAVVREIFSDPIETMSGCMSKRLTEILLMIWLVFALSFFALVVGGMLAARFV